MGHIANLRNQFKALAISLCWLGAEKNSISFLRIEYSIIVKSWFPFTLWRFVPSLVEIGPVVLKMKIYKFDQCILTNL